MQVDIDEIGVAKIRGAEFFVAVYLSDSTTRVYVAPLDKEGGLNQRWMVLDSDLHGLKNGCITVYTTQQILLMYRSLKEDGVPVRAFKEIGHHFLIRSGKLRMKVRDGCPGCRRFWGGDCSEGQCSKCHRCYACCGKASIPYSCENQASIKRYVRRRK